MATEEDIQIDELKTTINNLTDLIADLQKRVTAIEQLLRQAHIL